MFAERVPGRNFSNYLGSADGTLSQHLPMAASSGDEFKRSFSRRTPHTANRGGRAFQKAECRRSPKMARLEAALFVAEGATSTRRLAQVAMLADTTEARTLIEALNETYEKSGSAFRVERVATGYQILTRPEFAVWLDKLHHRQSELKLSIPALETLTIVAYRQPITRADVEAIRGVQCAEMLKQLMERGLVRIGGEDDSLGRPYLYETTRQFLELFGLQNLDELPMAERLAIKQSREPEENEASSAMDDSDEENQPEDADQFVEADCPTADEAA